MGLKVVFLVLSVSIVNARPQFFQPLFYQRQGNPAPHVRSLVSSEQTFYPNLANYQPQGENANTHFLNAEIRTVQNVNNRQAEGTRVGQQILLNQNYNDQTGNTRTFVKTNQQVQNLKENQFLQSNPMNSQTYQRFEQTVPTQNSTRHRNELKVNGHRNIQQSNVRSNATIHNQENTTGVINANRYKNTLMKPNATNHNQVHPKTNVINKQTTLYEKTPIWNEALDPNARDNVTNKQFYNNTADPYRSNADANQNRKTVIRNENAYNGRSNNSSPKPVSGVANPPVLDIPNRADQEGRMGDDNMKGEDDRWVWGLADVTEKETTATTVDVDDRASFDGDACPSGKVKVGTLCVDKQ